MNKLQQETLAAMKQRLEYNKGDVLTISAMADLEEEIGPVIPDEWKRVIALRDAAECAALVEKANKRLYDIRQEYQKAIGELNEAVMIARKKCPHPVTKYYGDVSGNNDSTTVCLCCGGYV